MVSETLCFCPLRGLCVISTVKQRKDMFPSTAHNHHNRRTCFKMGAGQEKSLQRKVAGDWPRPTLQVVQQPLVMTPADHSPCEKAVAALMRLPETMVWCNVGRAHKMIHGLHLFAFCLFGAMMRYLFENVMGVQFMGL